jgi:hypothetical protein
VLSKSLPRFVFESVMIVFSILLALGVSQCSEQASRRERAQVALRNIHAEITTNAASLRRSVPYHRDMVKRLDALLADSAAVLRREGMVGTLGRIAPEGLQPPTLSSTAWEMATMTDAVARTDYSRLYAISRLYQLQRMGVEGTLPRLSELIFSPDAFRTEQDPLPSLRLLQLILNELLTQEEYLLERYGEVLRANAG